MKPSGFYKVKAKRIKEVSKIIMEKYSGKVPDNLKNLLSLPGVGRKTANCVLVYGFDKPAIPVDVHVHRVANRLGFVKTKSPEETEKDLMEKIPKKYWKKINHIFVEFGKNVCSAKPKCKKCPLFECPNRKKH
ncbi:MAG: endonuclease III [Euryarchaeota archaeon CG01_land_8_20_14_3_00_38_12]|nr:MAG: endonuclease III [Euryarchaeota archaeon CG01_land_8_20_14_3_00_38_12]